MLNHKSILIFIAVLFGLAGTQSVLAQTDIYMEVPDIAGESNHKDHRDWIDLDSFFYPVEQVQRNSTGRSRTRSRAVVGPVLIGKQGDAASVYLNLATLQGKSFDQIVIEITDGSTLKFRYEFSNVVFTSYSHEANAGGTGSDETVGMQFESIRVLYIETNDDGSESDEHEIEYDIAAGV